MSFNSELHKLGRVNPGDNVRGVARSDRIMALQNISKSSVNGDQFSQSGNLNRIIGPGWVIHRNRRARSFSGTVSNTPFKIRTFDADPPFGDWRVAIYPGTINNMIPSNIFDNKSFDRYGTSYIVLNVQTDGYRPTFAVWDVDSSSPGPFDITVGVAPPFFSVAIGMIIVGKIFQFIDSLILANPKLVLQTVAEEPGVGRPYYDLNYSWDISQY